MRHPHFIDFWVTNFRNTAQWDKKRWHGLTTVVWKSSHGAQTNSDQLQSPDPQLFSIPMKWNMFKWPLATFHLIGISQIIWKHFNFQSNMFYAQLNSCVMHECRMKRTMSLNSNQWRLLQDNKSIYYRVKWKSVEPREQIKPALSQYNLKIQLSPTKYTYTLVLQVEKESIVPRNITICSMAPLDSSLAGETPNSIDFSSKLFWLQS